MTERRVHVSPRLETAISLIDSCGTIADIGCDHGRTTAAILQRKMCSRVIATDISEGSLHKAITLLRHIGLDHAVSFRLGSGLSVLRDSECDALMILGMGGTLMARILNDSSIPLKGAGYVILQPMRAQADIREYLHQNNYQITDDRIVLEHGRYYQVLKAVPGCIQQAVPKDWPSGFYDLGFMSYLNGEKLLYDLAQYQLSQHLARMHDVKGSIGEKAISEKIASIKQILDLL